MMRNNRLFTNEFADIHVIVWQTGAAG